MNYAENKFCRRYYEIIYEVIESDKWNKIVNHKKIISTLKGSGFRIFQKIGIHSSKGILKYDMHAKK